MNSSTIDRFNVVELIPQREPFVMISKLLYSGKNSVTSTLNISEENLFVKDHKFQESGLIENIAQTAAAMSGYEAKIAGKEVEMGFLGGVKNLLVNYLPDVNTSITTEVTLEDKVMNVNLIKGWVRQENRVVAECEMKVFLINN